MTTSGNANRGTATMGNTNDDDDDDAGDDDDEVVRSCGAIEVNASVVVVNEVATMTNRMTRTAAARFETEDSGNNNFILSYIDLIIIYT